MHTIPGSSEATRISEPFKLLTFLSSLPRIILFLTSRNSVKSHPVEFTPEKMPKFNKPELSMILHNQSPALIPNGLYIASPPVSGKLSTKAVNVPLSLYSYRPKRWAYITFPFQELMDVAMKQLIGYQGHTLQWNLPDDTNKLW
ncbi:hypothetical protein RclHR1_13730003 [Rhizophagus clarus]|uniref:Uncharacterized protein n=1 Tax=Rhizophagus clarus TaxID=94130 RepID=A0A2Z6QAV6_9GLOM|nr:hypothetical protein RclHR1_13730003 [Rhizophagus clarus]